jgi:hypothetical protein
MSDPVTFRATLDVTGASEAHVTAFAITHLRTHGYSVTAPNESWEKLKVFLKRLGISYTHFRRVIQHPHRPDVLVFPTTARVQEILSNPDFDAFCLRNKKEVARLSKVANSK